MTSIQSFPFAAQGKPFPSARQQTVQPYRAKLAAQQDSTHFASSHNPKIDIPLTEEPHEEPTDGEILDLHNPDDRAILTEKYISQFKNRETQQNLTQHIQEHPAVAVKPSVYVNALRQLVTQHDDLSPELAVSAYSKFVQQQIELDNPLARQLQDLPRARQHKQSLQNSKTEATTDTTPSQNPFQQLAKP